MHQAAGRIVLMACMPLQTCHVVLESAHPQSVSHNPEDNDTLTLRGQCRGEGYAIGFGDCTGKVIPALADPYAR